MNLENGARYSFVFNNKEERGKYEQLSGNFFVGKKESYSEHDNYFEAAACSNLKKLGKAMTKEKDLEVAWCNIVEALSDLAICKALAKIEELQAYVQSDTLWVVVTDGNDYCFNPLMNNDQCVDLMIKYDVERIYEPYDFIGWGYRILDGKNPIRILERQDFDGSGEPDISMQKATCLAVILNKANPEMLASII